MDLVKGVREARFKLFLTVIAQQNELALGEFFEARSDFRFLVSPDLFIVKDVETKRATWKQFLDFDFCIDDRLDIVVRERIEENKKFMSVVRFFMVNGL